MPIREPKRELAAALGKIPSGIFVLTACHGKAETGMLASWVQQCSFDPPQLTVAIRRGRYLADWLTEGATFTLNILDDAQTDMIGHFGRGFEADADADAFEGLEVERRNGAAPILTECLGYLDCKVMSRYPAGDHDVFIGHVITGIVLNDGRPMVHVRKSGFHY